MSEQPHRCEHDVVTCQCLETRKLELDQLETHLLAPSHDHRSSDLRMVHCFHHYFQRIQVASCFFLTLGLQRKDLPHAHLLRRVGRMKEEAEKRSGYLHCAVTFLLSFGPLLSSVLPSFDQS